MAAPMTWKTMNIGTLNGAMPEKVSLKARASVTAGLAKEADEVKKHAAPIQAAMSTGAN